MSAGIFANDLLPKPIFDAAGVPPPIFDVGAAPNPYINQIVPVTGVIAAGTNSVSVVISGCLHPELVEFVWNNFYTDDATFNPAEILPRVEKTASDATSVTFTISRNSSSTSVTTVVGYAIEYTPLAVESITYGTGAISGAGTSTAATIPSVDTTRSVVTYLGVTSTATVTTSGGKASVTLTNATTVTVSKIRTETVIVAFCVVQYKAAVIVSLEQRSSTLATANLTDTVTLATTVTVANSVIFYGGAEGASSSFNNYFVGLAIDNSLSTSNNVILTRQGTSTSNRTVRFTVINFISGFFKTVQQGVIAAPGP